MQSLFFRFVLLISTIGAFIAPVGAFYYKGLNSAEFWAVFAASLAVLTSIFSAWSSMGLMEIERDRQRPNPYPYVDFRSRYGLALFTIKNFGASPAHNIRLVWSPKIKNYNDEEVGFDSSNGEIGVLMPNQTISKVLGASHEIYQRNGDILFFKGIVLYDDINGKSYECPFVIDLASYAGTPQDDDEIAKTGFMLQKIPDELSKIKKELSIISSKLNQCD